MPEKRLQIRFDLNPSEDPVLHAVFSALPLRTRSKTLRAAMRQIPITAFGISAKDLPKAAKDVSVARARIAREISVSGPVVSEKTNGKKERKKAKKDKKK